MKRIIMLVLLFAALKVAGQTTGYLRFDTVKIMKQNGTCELYVINSTKDSLGVLTNVGGGLTRFIKPKVLNDSTIIVGLDTLVLRGASGSGSSITLNNIGTGYALVATPGGNIKRINNNYGILIDSTTTANTITIRADTASTNHVVTQSDLNDAIAGAVGNQNIQQVLNTGDTARRPIKYNYNADTTDDAYLWEVIPSNYLTDYGAEGVQGKYSAGWHRGNGVNASGRPNVVFNFAQYNTSNGGGRINTGDAAARFAIETHFNTGGQRLFEIHVPELTLYNGTQKRPFTMYMNKETGATQFNYYSTAGVDYQNPAGQGLLSFGGSGGLQVFGRPGNLSLVLQDDDGSIYRDLLLEGGGIQHLSYGGDQFFDSRTIFNNTNNNLPSVIVSDHRSASTIGLQLHIDETSAAKTPIQIDANTVGGIETQFLNGTGTSKHKIVGIGNDCNISVRNLNPNDPGNGDYNAGYVFVSSGNGASSGSLGAYFGDSNLGDIDESELILNTGNVPLAFTVSAFEKMRMTTGGSFLIGRKIAIGAEKLSVNGTINALADSTNTPSNMLWMDGNGHIKKAAVPSGGSSYTFSNGITESAGAVKWGGTLTQNTTIDGGSSYTTTFTGSRTSANSTLLAENSSSGRGITGSSSSGVGAYGSSTSGAGITGQSSSGSGVFGLSSSGVGVQAQSTTGQALTAISPNTNGAASITANPSSTNTTHTVLRLTRLSTSAGANNIAGSIDFDINNSTGAGSVVTANQIVSKLTTATAGSEVAQFDVWGYNSGVNYRRFSILGTGQMEWPYYGSGTYTGTISKYIGVTSAGAVVEQAASTIPLISAGTAAPATTPGKVGDIYVDTTNKKLYFATGTSSSADWTIAN